VGLSFSSASTVTEPAVIVMRLGMAHLPIG
jgi:hypothetical protein